MSSIGCALSALHLLCMDWPLRNGCPLGQILISYEFFTLFRAGLAARYRNVFIENAQTQCAKGAHVLISMSCPAAIVTCLPFGLFINHKRDG